MVTIKKGDRVRYAVAYAMPEGIVTKVNQTRGIAHVRWGRRKVEGTS
jgi:hypothetical protein